MAQQAITRTDFWRDQLFWAALVAALPFWAGLWWWMRPPLHPWQQIRSDWIPATLIILIYPVVEEIVFRGALQGWLLEKLKKQFGPVTSANLLTSFLFTVLHGLRWHTGWSLLVIIPSLVFGFFRERSNGLMAPIVLHIFYNAGFFLLVSPVVGGR